MSLPYDPTSPIAIEEYAQYLVDKTFRDILPKDKNIHSRHKGGLGTILEENYFLYKPNSEAAPDFPEAGVELKVTPYKKNKNGTYSAKERLVLNIINYMSLSQETFENGSFWTKNKLLLLIFYLYEQESQRFDYTITHARLFEFPEKDLQIIKDDWHKIRQKVLSGLAHELSESDTNYLSACTKGANKESVRPQPFSSILAKQRAYSLKSSYMTYILNNYILNGNYIYKKRQEALTDNLGSFTLEGYVIHKLSAYKNRTLQSLIDYFNLQGKQKAKDITYKVASKIINEDLDDLRQAEEFQKANIKVKAIRIGKNGKIKEHMSFPTFKYTEIVQEEWETSELRTMFLDTRFLFIVFQDTEKYGLVLSQAVFWNMPHDDLEIKVRSVWEETVHRIKERKADQLPRKTEFEVCHVRPHARNGNDTYLTPYGTHEVKKCFWLNSDYILEQINKADSYLNNI